MPSAARAAAAGSGRVSTPGGAAARRAMGIPRPPEDCRNRAKTLATNIIRAFGGWPHALWLLCVYRYEPRFVRQRKAEMSELFLSGLRRQENMSATRRFAAILAADVAGYSRLLAPDGEGTRWTRSKT